MYEEQYQLIASRVGSTSGRHFNARQTLEIHTEVLNRVDPTILELGVRSGGSTKIFLNALHRGSGGHLVSVDILDCSNVVDSPRWQFLQSDSADISRVIEAAPILKQGIDIIYVDSLHTPEHICKELYGYYPFVKKGGIIFFDDIDSLPYMQNQSKDNIHTEIGNRQSMDLINRAFESNLDQIELTIRRGGTGMARLDKRSEMSTQLAPPFGLKKRTSKTFWKFKQSLNKRYGWLQST